MNKISVLEIIGDSSLAGAPRHLLSIVQNLDNKKYEIHVICPPGPLSGEINGLSRHIDLDLIPMNSRWDINAIKKIRRRIKKIKPNVIHIHGTRAGSVGRLASIGLNIPLIYTEHLRTKHFRINSRILNRIHMAAYWFFDLFTTLNIAVSGAVKDFMIDNDITRENKVKVIYNGIESNAHKANIFSNDKEYLIATVGTLNKNKGIQYLLKAIPNVISEFPTAKFEIIGDGPYRKKLQSLAEKLKITKNVKFVGFVADVDKYLTKFDLYVQPSLSESFGLAIVQAMGVGLPVVASNAGGIPEVVTDEKSGILVEPADPNALKDAILRILRDPNYARKMGDMARKEAQVRFNLKDMIDELEAVYEEISENPAFT